MKKVPSTEVKKRSRELTSIFESFSPYKGMEGQVERIWITEIAADGIHLVGHTKNYVQVLVVASESMLGTSAYVKITSTGRWSVFGEILSVEVVSKEGGCLKTKPSISECLPDEDSQSTCACSTKPEPCSCFGSCHDNGKSDAKVHVHSPAARYYKGANLVGNFASLLLRKRKVQHAETTSRQSSSSSSKNDCKSYRRELSNLDMLLVVGMLLSSLVILLLFGLLFYRKSST